MTSSGTYTFNPALSDIVLDAFDRCGIRPAAITPDHMFSAKRSLNFVLARWSNRVPNQWLTEEIFTPLVSGQKSYLFPMGSVAVFDVFVRSYQLGSAVDIAPSITTVIASPLVTVTWANHGLVANQWVNVAIPVTISGIVLFGFYQVVSIPSTDTFVVNVVDLAGANATGGVVPSYTVTAALTAVTMNFDSHGFVTGDNWTVHEQLSIGGIVLLGDYLITSTTLNSLTFDAPQAAGFSETLPENGGLTQYAAADQDALPQDRILTPIGRAEWAAIPSKSTPSQYPTSYWFERLLTPVMHLWPVPDVTAPMELHCFIMRQAQDANPQNTETPDIPYRFEEAFCADLAAHIAIKWAVDKLEMLTALASDAWKEAAGEDRERVVLNITPQLQGYFR